MNKGPRSLRALSMNFSKKGPGDYSSPLSVSRAPKRKVQAQSSVNYGKSSGLLRLITDSPTSVNYGWSYG